MFGPSDAVEFVHKLLKVGVVSEISISLFSNHFTSFLDLAFDLSLIFCMTHFSFYLLK